MKKITITLIALIFGFTSLMAQSPQTFKYQAVARDNLGKILVNQLVGLRISILKDSPLGATMYMETHTKGTNEFGIVTLNVGGGTAVTGNFNNIDWSNGEYFIKTELDIAGTGTYIFIGSSQLLSVPFALHAEYATKAGKAMNDQDTSATNELQTITKTDNTITLSQGGGSLIDSDNQTISLTGNQLTISNGNTLVLSGAVDLDSDPTNELQLLHKSNDTIYLSQGNDVVLPHDVDRDSTNEIQQMQLSHNILHLTKANTITIDADTTNEIQLLSKNNNILNISKGNSVIIDADTTNEIQQMQLNHNTLHLTKANTITIDADTTNEIQTLSYYHDTLSISKGNNILLQTPLNLPDGISDILPVQFSSPYTVPQGKNLYITQYVNGSLEINGITIVSGNYFYINTSNPIIASSGDVISSQGSVYGFLAQKRVQPITISILANGTYTVPSGKLLIITNLCFVNGGQILINNIQILSGNYFGNQDPQKSLNFPIIVKSGDTVKMSADGSFNGYLR